MDILDNKYREIFLVGEAKQVKSVILSISNAKATEKATITDIPIKDR